MAYTGLRNPVTIWNEIGPVGSDNPLVVVVAGGLGGGGGVAAYVHTQASAATTWTINHNLGYQPSVELISTGGAEFEGTVIHTSVNQTVCSFEIAVAGTARLI